MWRFDPGSSARQVTGARSGVDMQPIANPGHRSMLPRTATTEDRLRQRLGTGLLTQEPLRHHTTMRIGGPADFYFAARTADQLVVALRTAHQLELPLFLL